MPQYALCILVTLRGRHLKNKNVGEVFSDTPYLSKDRSSKRNSFVTNPLLRSVVNEERLTLVTGEDMKSGQHTQTHFVTNCPSALCSSKIPLGMPKYYVLSPKRPTSPFPFPVKMTFQPEFYATS